MMGELGLPSWKLLKITYFMLSVYKTIKYLLWSNIPQFILHLIFILSCNIQVSSGSYNFQFENACVSQV